MCEKAVFALIDGNSKPVAAANLWLYLKQQFAADGEKASADAAHAARPVLGNLVELERGVVDKRLDRGDSAGIGVPDSYPAAYGPDLWFGETGRQFPNRVRMKDAVRVDGDDDLARGVLQGIAHRARLASVLVIPAYPDLDVGEVTLRLEHPLVTLVR